MDAIVGPAKVARSRSAHSDRADGSVGATARRRNRSCRVTDPGDRFWAEAVAQSRTPWRSLPWQSTRPSWRRRTTPASPMESPVRSRATAKAVVRPPNRERLRSRDSARRLCTEPRHRVGDIASAGWSAGDLARCCVSIKTTA